MKHYKKINKKLYPKANVGKDNGMWKGAQASYFGIHSWLNRHYKKIRCAFCKKENPPTKRKNLLEFALKKGKKHARKIENYLVLCSKCHKNYDFGGKPPHNKGVLRVKPLICQWCKNEFHPYRKVLRFCSNKCSSAHRWAGYVGPYSEKVHPIKP